VKGCAAIDPATPVMVAGDPERMTREERLREGVPVDAGTWKQLAELAASLDIAPPAEA
jgi:LDH2 family malate/lactate/ureidoglycolate dehydrogenase